MAAAVYHVLPDDQPQTVAVVVPAVGLDFDVLADHVEAGFSDLRKIEDHCFVRRRRVNAVRPVSLIQHALLKNHFMIETQPRAYAPGPVFERPLLHGKTTQRRIRPHAVLPRTNIKIIQIRILAAPESSLPRRNLHGNPAVRAAGRKEFAGGDRLGADLPAGRSRRCIRHPYLHRKIRFRFHRNQKFSRIGIRNNFQTRDILLRDILYPDTLPDTADSCVKHASALQLLLSSGMIGSI